jgi:hypothetical protein
MPQPKTPQPKIPNRFEKYGCLWEKLNHPLAIEMSMIRNGGRWKGQDGQIKGEGLVYHYRMLQTILWPEKIWHKWSLLELECWVKYRIIGEVGPASSGKSFSGATNMLADYYVFPDCTTVLVSSTTKESLEMRVWGEIKKFHRLAKSRFSWLPGNLIEGRQRIVTDSRAECVEGRDFRNGCVGVPCLPSGTLVDTPTGKIRIESVQPGQIVTNAAGQGMVLKVGSRIATRLLRVTLSDGRTIDITEDHPIFTQRGWVNAIDLETSDMVFSACETLSILQASPATRLSESKVLQCSMPQQASQKKVSSVRKTVSTLEPETRMDRQNQGQILQSSLFGNMGVQAQAFHAGPREEMRALRKGYEESPFWEAILLHGLPKQDNCEALRTLRPSIQIYSGITSQEAISVLRQILQDELSGEYQFQKSHSPEQRRDFGLESISRGSNALPFEDGEKKLDRAKSLVSTRFGISGNQVGRGDRRRHSLDPVQNNTRSEKGQGACGTRVVNVEVLDSASDPRFIESEGGYRVHNLEVDCHPSYSVNGVIVHNCKRGGNYQGLAEYVGIKNKRLRLLADELQFMPPTFVDSIANLNKNLDFKCIGLGNCKDVTDALGKLCEPAPEEGGWDGGIDQTPGTKTWKIRFPSGICIQLPGSDSPNLDGKLDCPLISQEKIDEDIAFYGKDSIQYTMMDEGRMPRGMGSRRVITAQLCRKFRALEEPVWGGSPRTPIGFLDAAYKGTGGDRCIFGELQFGKDVEGTNIIALVSIMVVPIKDNDEIPAEDQIVLFCKEQCEARGIVPQNFGYDSTGRGTLGTAFGRLWSANVIPIEFGGSATENRYIPSGTGMDVSCKDYFFNFVSELWYSSRWIIEAGQFRGMLEDVMQEGCQREWMIVGKNKIQVEPKEKMKIKTGRSPDLYDGLCTGIELARRRGFVIQKTKFRSAVSDNGQWKGELREKARKLASQGQLTYSS